MPIKCNIKEYREMLGWTQEQLAQKSGIGQSTISEAESGKHVPSLEVALRISEALEVSVNKLFSLFD